MTVVLCGQQRADGAAEGLQVEILTSGPLDDAVELRQFGELLARAVSTIEGTDR